MHSLSTCGQAVLTSLFLFIHILTSHMTITTNFYFYIFIIYFRTSTKRGGTTSEHFH